MFGYCYLVWVVYKDCVRMSDGKMEDRTTLEHYGGHHKEEDSKGHQIFQQRKIKKLQKSNSNMLEHYGRHHKEDRTLKATKYFNNEEKKNNKNQIRI